MDAASSWALSKAEVLTKQRNKITTTTPDQKRRACILFLLDGAKNGRADSTEQVVVNTGCLSTKKTHVIPGPSVSMVKDSASVANKQQLAFHNGFDLNYI
jgi:hypothetical protein